MREPQPARKRWRPALALVAALVASCAYRIDIQQGNHLDEETVAQLAEGMTRKQVRFLLGTPMIEDPFHAQRWDYVYYLKPGRKRITAQSHLIVYFSGDTVTRIERGDASQAPGG
jgi:outer membrane protein assembly factor BamE